MEGELHYSGLELSEQLKGKMHSSCCLYTMTCTIGLTFRDESVCVEGDREARYCPGPSVTVKWSLWSRSRYACGRLFKWTPLNWHALLLCLVCSRSVSTLRVGKFNLLCNIVEQISFTVSLLYCITTHWIYTKSNSDIHVCRKHARRDSCKISVIHTRNFKC